MNYDEKSDLSLAVEYKTFHFEINFLELLKKNCRITAWDIVKPRKSTHLYFMSKYIVAF